MNYRVIGDIHGRKVWKKLVDADSLCVFVGDYFDPYDDIPFQDCMDNMKEILQYKSEHPQTILLLGNHDTHYLCDDKERCTRYMTGYEQAIERLFREHINAFEGVTYSPDYKVLISHAGVAAEWMERRLRIKSQCVKLLSQEINDLFWAGFGSKDWSGFDNFSLVNNRTGFDLDGSSANASPLWIRPWRLLVDNKNAGFNIPQIFGHTRVDAQNIVFENYACADCLSTLACYITVDENDKFKAVTVG